MALQLQKIISVILFFLLVSCGENRLPKDIFSKEKISVEISGSVFNIPANYIQKMGAPVNSKEKDTYVKYIMLETIWPHMEGLTKNNKDIFQKKRLNNLIFGLWAANSGGRFIDEKYTSYQNLVRRNQIISSKMNKELGLTHYLTSLQHIYIPISDKETTPSGLPLVYSCLSFTEKILSQFPDAELRCETYYKLPNGVWLYYSFYKKNIKHWKEINIDILTLINSFMSLEGK